MIERLEDMPDGVLGFKLTGEITRADYDDVLMPAIRVAIESGTKVRALTQIGPGFDGYDKGAVWADVKAGAEWGIGGHSSWECIALVTDERKLRKLASIFGWMSPGELKTFKLKELDEAKAWTSGGFNSQES